MKTSRIIFHIDLNCFFASCEIAENPQLQGKPIVIARDNMSRKSLIVSPSYEARKYGIKTTMLVSEAKRLCEDIIVVESQYGLYEEYSKKFFSYLYKITPLIEITSIDEGYLDMTEVCNGRDAIKIANNIQNDLLEYFKLPCSIGIAPNKFLAKMASDIKKPLGVTVLRRREINQYLWPLSIEAMYGVGRKTAPRLKEIGINTIGDLANYQNSDLLKKTIGEAWSKALKMLANGIDNSPVDPHSHTEFSSISNSYTFDYDTSDTVFIKQTLRALTNTVCRRMQEKEVSARTIGIQIKYKDFRLINRSKSVQIPVNDERDVYEIVVDLFDDYYNEEEIRLVGVFVNRFAEVKSDIKQMTIFDNMDKVEKENEIQHLMNDVKRLYGNDSIAIGFYKHKKEEK